MNTKRTVLYSGDRLRCSDASNGCCELVHCGSTKAHQLFSSNRMAWCVSALAAAAPVHLVLLPEADPVLLYLCQHHSKAVQGGISEICSKDRRAG